MNRRKNKRRPGGVGVDKASVLAGLGHHSAPLPWSQVMRGDTLYPAAAIHDGLLTNGPKRFRVLVQHDEHNKIMPTAFIVDNRRRTVLSIHTAMLGKLAKTVRNRDQAAMLRNIADTYHAEQSGMRGRA